MKNNFRLLLNLCLITVFIASTISVSSCRKIKAKIATSKAGSKSYGGQTFTDGYIYFPNAFSPDGNSINDQFFPITKNIASIHWEIKNGIGITLFESDDIGGKWDGNHKGKLQIGMFKLSFTATTNSGETIAGKGKGIAIDYNYIKCVNNPDELFFAYNFDLTSGAFVNFYSSTNPVCEKIAVCK